METLTDSKSQKLEIPAKFVYYFAAGEAEGNAGMKNILGGKGANLAEMTAIGLDVPPGFTISTDICTHFYLEGGKLPEWVRPKVLEALKRVETKIGKKFGGKHHTTVLHSVRKIEKLRTENSEFNKEINSLISFIQ